MFKNDPIGNAIWDYHLENAPEDITVESDLMEDDYIPTSYLFREYDDFPQLEKEAMKHCRGSILDIGAAAGPHTNYLLSQNFEVTTVEISPNAHTYLKTKFPKAQHHHISIFDFKGHKYDTLLLMMNGIGLAGNYDEIVPFLKHLASLLNKNGRILAESTDVIDIFEDDEGGLWIDLNARYYGEFKFNMKYKDVESDWFEWIYLDRVNFIKLAEEAGLKATILYDEEQSFLIELTHN